jgi:serine/threonine protein kinase
LPDLIGQSLGRYHILEQLGEGGMATVYKAYDARLERHVAIKVILTQKQQTEKFLKRFEREARALAQLTHPNIVGIIDYGSHMGLPYLVMEYIPSGTLKVRLGKPILYQEAARMLAPIARALAYAHEKKIIHRDIKPANILITQSGEPMLSDFGIAKILESEETVDLTGTGIGVGTPEYMSPEQAQGKPVDARSDIYSLGVVLFEMVTGRKPYQADTPMAVVWKQASEPLPRPRQFVIDLPEAVEGILLKALAKNPEDRYSDMGTFAVVLDGLTSSNLKAGKATRFRRESVSKPPSQLGEEPKYRRWKPLIAAFAALGLLLAVGGSLWWLRMNNFGITTPNTPSVFTTNMPGSTTSLKLVIMTGSEGTKASPEFQLEGNFPGSPLIIKLDQAGELSPGSAYTHSATINGQLCDLTYLFFSNKNSDSWELREFQLYANDYLFMGFGYPPNEVILNSSNPTIMWNVRSSPEYASRCSVIGIGSPTDLPVPISTLDPNFSVTGAVVGTDDLPIGGVIVAFLQGEENLQVSSSADGSFAYNLPTSGTWEVQIVGIEAESPARILGYFEIISHVTITLPQTTPVELVYEKATLHIDGIVKNNSDVPMANARVFATRADGAFSWVTTDDAGYFVLPASSGKWSVFANNSLFEQGEVIIIDINTGETPEPLILHAP